MRVSVVIVNYCSARLVLDCLASLASERHDLDDLDVVVVENVSPDDSFAVLDEGVKAAGWRDWVTLRAMPVNGGFSYGVNAGVAAGLASDAPPDAFWLLNPDTVVRPGAARALVDALEEDREVGVVGSRLEDVDGTAQHSRFRFPSILSELEVGSRLGLVGRLIGDRATCPPISDEAHDIDWIAGASMLVRREVFDEVGMFDERFFLYFEEVDFLRRSARAGFRTRYVPASRVVHFVGQSTGVTARGARPGRTPAYWFGSRKLYFKIHHSGCYKLVADVLFVAGRLVYHLLRVLRRRPDTEPPSFLRDFVRFNWLGGATARPPGTTPTVVNSWQP